MPIISGTVGVISSSMQNVGAPALFLPVVSRVSVRTDLPLSRLVISMGFCAILGGTMTMVGSSPLILLNDLIVTAFARPEESRQMQTFGMFSVMPVGAVLALTGIACFMLFGRLVLPARTRDEATRGVSIRDYVHNLDNADTDLFEIEVPEG